MPQEAPTGVPSAPQSLSSVEGKALLKAFKKAQKQEAQALSHHQKFEVRELKASQDARFREWKLKEQEERRKFFANNNKAKEKRAYIRDFMGRRDALLALFAKERKDRVREHEVRRKSTREEQAEKLKQFQDYLGRGERPPESLWPRVGGV